MVAHDLPEKRLSAQQAALYVEPNDPRRLAAAIIELAADPQRGASTGRFGRHRVKEEFAWQHSDQPLLEAVARLDGHRPRASVGAPTIAEA
jgi:hypothetical protein